MNVLRILLNSKRSSETWESPCCLAWKSIHTLAPLLSTSLTHLPVTQGCCKFPQDSFGNKSRSDDSPAINTRNYPCRDLHKDFTQRAVALSWLTTAPNSWGKLLHMPPVQGVSLLTVNPRLTMFCYSLNKLHPWNCSNCSDATKKEILKRKQNQ